MRAELMRAGAAALAVAAIAAGAACLLAGARSDTGAGPDASRLHVFQRDETDRLDVHVFIPYRAEIPGLAHYVEHLAWLGATKDWASLRLGRTGAWTTPHAFHYWISARNSSLDELLGTIGGVFGPMALAEQYALSERGIILREYRQLEFENPWHRIYERINAELYSGNPAAVPVLGDPEDIGALDLPLARKMHADTHLISNAVFVIDGNIAEDAALRALRGLGLPEAGANGAAIHRPAFSLAPGERIVIRLARDALPPQVVWRRIIRLAEETPYEVLASRAGLLAMILAANRPGGLVKTLQFDQAAARTFNIWLHAIDGRHVELGFIGRPDRGVTMTGLVEAFEQALAQTASAGIPQATYDQVFRQHARKWPDWDSRSEVSRHMKELALARLSEWRPPPDAETDKGAAWPAAAAGD